jgi:stearoyl-CoA desaturase (delta-9 desaturase)
MSKSWERFFFIFSWITQGSSSLSPNTYGILHRMHHAYADTEKDPHSPKYDGNLFKMMWKTKDRYNDIFYNKVRVDTAFKKEVPEWYAFDHFTNKWYIRLLWAAAYIAFYVQFATAWWMFLFLPIHFIMGPLHGAIINWFAHKYGYINFVLRDTSKNLLPFDFLMMGESYHNNHHYNSKNANFGFRWFEMDPGFVIIQIFDKLKIIKIRKQEI